MPLKKPYRTHRQMDLGDFLDELAGQGLLEWAWEYDETASRALFVIAEPGRARVRYLIRDAEAVAARVAARVGIIWLPVPPPGNDDAHRRARDRNRSSAGTPERTPAGTRPDPNTPAPERILSAAADLFTARGVDQVPVDELIARSGVAKATFYKYSTRKDELAREYLKHWHRMRSSAIDAAVRAHGGASWSTLACILADVIDEWLESLDGDAAAYLHSEPTDEDDIVGQAYADHFSRINEQIAGLARTAGLLDPEDFARSWHIIVSGAIIAAVEGGPDASRMAKHLTSILIASQK